MIMKQELKTSKLLKQEKVIKKIGQRTFWYFIPKMYNFCQILQGIAIHEL